MNVLVCGATGFIGRRLVDRLWTRGHGVIAGARDPGTLPATYPGVRGVAIDFGRDQVAETWPGRLAGVDAVVNAVGIFGGAAARFDALHVAGPRALFDACVSAGVTRVIQISALGADADAQTQYHRSKYAADTHLRALPLDWTIVQPSLVYGPGGGSARLFTAMASLPLIPLPGRGGQPVQPVHLDDLICALVALLENRACVHATVPAVGPQPLALRDMLDGLRTALGLPAAHFLPTPMPLARLGATLAGHMHGALISRDALNMLERGNQAEAGTIASLLGHAPRPVQAFIDPREASSVRRAAQLAWLLPLLRFAIALVWLGSGAVSLGLYPVERSYALLAQVGIAGSLAAPVLYGAACLDIALGVATLVLPHRRALWLFQIALIVTYSAIIAVWLPAFWLHPFGPVLKNLAILAILVVLLVLER